MPSSISGGVLRLRLGHHFALSGVAAVGIAAASASAQIVYSTPNLVIPADIDGLYINVETQQTGSSSGSVPGWDLNPYGETSITWFNATGTGMLRFPGVTTGSAGNLPLNAPVDAAGSYGSGDVTFGTAAGNWVLNSSNYFAFRFTGSSNQTHYGWGRMVVGATVGTRTITEIAYESTPGVPISVGSTGGGSPPYDPCAPFNPSLQVGSNNVGVRDNAANLAIAGCGGTAFKANYFKFVPPINGVYTFSTCGSEAATRMALLIGCTPNSAQVACNDSFCGSSSQISMALSGGQPVYVVVGADSAGVSLPSMLEITVDGPPEPRCAAAPTVGMGVTSIDTASNSGNVQVRTQAGTTTIFGARWYRFIPSVTGFFEFSLCGSVGDTKMALASACPAVGQVLDSIAYNDDDCECASGCGSSGVAAWASRLTFSNSGTPLTQALSAGQAYYLVVGSWSSLSGPVSADLRVSPLDCHARDVTRTSPQLVPYSFSSPAVWNVIGIPACSQGATLTVTARGQLGATTRFLTIKVDGVTLATNLFGAGSGAGSCAANSSTAVLPITPSQFAQLTADGQLQIRIEPSINATSAGCSTAELQVKLEYTRDIVDCDENLNDDECQMLLGGTAFDCDLNGQVDSCEVSFPGVDCDSNGIPDSCDIANGAEDKNDNGRLDSCELRYGDLNLDGQVNGTDLAGLLAVWGLPNPPYGDLDGNNVVNGADLANLLARWGPVP